MHFDYGLFVEKVLCFLIAIFTIFIFVVIPTVISKNVEQIQKDEDSKKELAKKKIKELNSRIQIGITLQEFNFIIEEIYKIRSSINLICHSVKCIYSSVNIKK